MLVNALYFERTGRAVKSVEILAALAVPQKIQNRLFKSLNPRCVLNPLGCSLQSDVWNIDVHHDDTALNLLFDTREKLDGYILFLRALWPRLSTIDLARYRLRKSACRDKSEKVCLNPFF